MSGLFLEWRPSHDGTEDQCENSSTSQVLLCSPVRSRQHHNSAGAGLAATARAVARVSEMGQVANSNDAGLLALMELTYSTYLIRYVTDLRLVSMGRHEQKRDMRTRERIIRPQAVLMLASPTRSIRLLFEKNTARRSGTTGASRRA